MKKSLIIIIAIVAVIAIAAAVYFISVPSPLEKTGEDSGQGTVAGGGSIVSIKNLKFNPSTVNIAVGEKVTWNNEDSVTHDVTINNGLFDVDIEAGKSFTYIFNQTGTYEYHCDIHPSMTGTVNVK